MGSFLDSLGMSGGAEVYVAVSASNKLEVATVDPKDFTIKSYAQTDLEYNESLREIANYNDFKDKLADLLRSCNVNPQKANVHLSLPTVWFGYKDNLPLLLDDSAITNVVMGELEQTYIFKRKDPIPFWFDALVSSNSDSRSIFYTALQEDVKLNLQSALKAIGANLVSIDCSIFSDLRALLSTNIASNQMNGDGESWALLVVNNSGFQLYGMQAKKILEYYEEPIAIKSYDENEIYSAIDNAAQVALLSSPSTSLVIISETDYVSAEILAKNIQFGGNIIPVEDNKFKKEPFMDMSLTVVKETQLKVSLNILGLIADRGIFPVDLNFLNTNGEKKSGSDIIEIPLGNGKVISLTPVKATIYAGVLLALILIPLGICAIASGVVKNNFVNKNNEVKAQLEQVENELKQYENKQQDVSFNEDREIETTLRNNRSKIMAYTALGESIPKELYLTYFMTGDSGYVDIQGCANSVEDVYVFFQNLKDSLIESKLRLSKLDLKTNSLDSVINSTMSTLDDAPYIFEITNMDDSQLRSFMNALSGSSADNNANQDQTGDKTTKGKNVKKQLEPAPSDVPKGIPENDGPPEPTN